MCEQDEVIPSPVLEELTLAGEKWQESIATHVGDCQPDSSKED